MRDKLKKKRETNVDKKNKIKGETNKIIGWFMFHDHEDEGATSIIICGRPFFFD